MYTIGPEPGQFQSRSSKYIPLKTSLKLRTANVRATTQRIVVSPIGPIFKSKESNKHLTYTHIHIYTLIYIYIYIYTNVHINIRMYQFPFKTM